MRCLFPAKKLNVFFPILDILGFLVYLEFRHFKLKSFWISCSITRRYIHVLLVVLVQDVNSVLLDVLVQDYLFRNR